MRAVLKARGGRTVAKVLGAASRAEAQAVLAGVEAWGLAELLRLSPAEHLGGLKAPVFMMHDKGDTFCTLYRVHGAGRRAISTSF